MATDSTGTKAERDERLRLLRESGDTWIDGADPSTVAAAKIEVAFLMAAADGTLGDDEIALFADTVALATAQRVERARVTAVTRDLVELLQLDGWEERVVCAARSIADPSARRVAYRMAAGVAFVDGRVHPNERYLFGMLAEAFGIPVDEASEILAEVRNVMFGVPPEDEPTGAIPLTTRKA